jgi:hypothetical protein
LYKSVPLPEPEIGVHTRHGLVLDTGILLPRPRERVEELCRITRRYGKWAVRVEGVTAASVRDANEPSKNRLRGFSNANSEKPLHIITGTKQDELLRLHVKPIAITKEVSELESDTRIVSYKNAGFRS